MKYFKITAEFVNNAAQLLVELNDKFIVCRAGVDSTFSSVYTAIIAVD